MHLTQREALEIKELIWEHKVTADKLGFLSRFAQDGQLRNLLQRHSSGFQRVVDDLFREFNPGQAAGVSGQANWQAAAGNVGTFSGTQFTSPTAYAGAGGAGGFGGQVQQYGGQYGGQYGTQYGAQYGGTQAGAWAQNRTDGSGGGLDDRTLAAECLKDCKYLALRAAMGALEMASAHLRQKMHGLCGEHLRMAQEMWDYMHNRGWYQVRRLSDSDIQQIAQALEAQLGRTFVPAGAGAGVGVAAGLSGAAVGATNYGNTGWQATGQFTGGQYTGGQFGAGPYGTSQYGTAHQGAGQYAAGQYNAGQYTASPYTPGQHTSGHSTGSRTYAGPELQNRADQDREEP